MPYKKKMSAESESSEMQELALMEQELQALNLELECKEYQHQVCKIYFKNYVQKNEHSFIKTLVNEETCVDTNLNLAQSSAVKKMDAKNQMEILNLRQAQLTFSEVVSNEQEKCKNLDKTIAELEEAIVNQRKKNGGAIRVHNSHVKRLKKIRVYENRLNTATVQLNKLLTENSDLREKIEHYRKQRNVFNTLYKRLQSKSNELKFQIGEVVNEATFAYNIRDENHSKMVSLNDRNTTDFKLHVAEEKEMTRIIAQESKLQKFMDTKNSEKSELAYQEALARQASFENKAEQQQEQEMVKFERVLASIVNILGQEKGEKLMGILKNTGMMGEDKVEKLKCAIEPVCDRYKKTEEQNFSLFQFVNDLSQDVKNLNSRIQSIEKQKKQSNDETHKTYKQGSNNVATLKSNLQKNTEYLEQLESQTRSTFHNFNSIKHKLSEIFVGLNCNDKLISKQLNNEQHVVTGENLDLYLSGIENKINALMQLEALDTACQSIEEGGLQNFMMSKPGTAGSDRKSMNSRQANRSLKDNENKKKNYDPVLDLESSNNIDFIDAVYGDLDKQLLGSGSFTNRATMLLNERERSKNVKTPKTPNRAKINTPGK